MARKIFEGNPQTLLCSGFTLTSISFSVPCAIDDVWLPARFLLMLKVPCENVGDKDMVRG